LSVSVLLLILLSLDDQRTNITVSGPAHRRPFLGDEPEQVTEMLVVIAEANQAGSVHLPSPSE
jgi:hypothetical protein